MTPNVVPVQVNYPHMLKMRDAEFPQGDEGFSGPIAGYIGGPNAANVWPPDTWEKSFKSNPKLPIWVGGFAGHLEGVQAVRTLEMLRVPAGCYVANDMETRIDRTYLEHFAQVVHGAGYKVLVYGSASSVFNNPQLNGYWVADYAGIGPFMYDHDGVRATQYAPGPSYDASVIKAWILKNFWQ